MFHLIIFNVVQLSVHNCLSFVFTYNKTEEGDHKKYEDGRRWDLQHLDLRPCDDTDVAEEACHDEEDHEADPSVHDDEYYCHRRRRCCCFSDHLGGTDEDGED